MKNLLVFIIAILGIGMVGATDELRFKMSPNPAANSVTILPDEYLGEVTVEIFSVIGNRLMEQKFTSEATSHMVVNLSQIPDGIYLVRLTTNKLSSVKRLKIQHN